MQRILEGRGLASQVAHDIVCAPASQGQNQWWGVVCYLGGGGEGHAPPGNIFCFLMQSYRRSSCLTTN